MYAKSILNSFRANRHLKMKSSNPKILKATSNGYLTSRGSTQINYAEITSPKKELLSQINNNNNFYRFSPSSMNINKRESNEYKTESNEIKNDSFLNSPVSSKSKKEIDSALLAKATAKLKNIIEKKRRRSFEKKKIIIATCKLQDILEKTSKRNMTISKSKRKKKSSFNHSVSMSHRKNKKEIKRESQLSTIFKEKDKIDKILKLESILTSHHTDSNSTVTYSESKRSQSPHQEPLTYSFAYMMSLKEKAICHTTSKLNALVLEHINQFDIHEDIKYENKWERIDISKEIAIAESFVNDIHIKNNTDNTKSDIIAIMNTITVDNYDTVRDIILGYIKESKENQLKFIEVIIKKAIGEKFYVGLYATMCKDIDKRNSNNEKKSFLRLHLIEECKKIFLSSTDESIDITDEESVLKYKKRMIGNVKFVSELIKVKMLSQKIGFFCMNSLLTRITEEKITEKERNIMLESLIELLDSFGKVVFERGNYQYIDVVNEFIDKMLSRYTSLSIPGFIKYRIINLIEKKNNQWKDTLFQQSTIAKGKSESSTTTTSPSSQKVIKELREEPVIEQPQLIKKDFNDDESNVIVIKNDIKNWIDFKEDDYKYDWSVVETMYRSLHSLGKIVSYYIEACIDIVDSEEKLIKATSYIEIVIEFYLQYMIRSEIDEMASLMINTYLNINDLIVDNKKMIDVLGNLLFILIDSRIIIMKKLNLFEKKEKSTIQNLCCIVKSAIEHSGTKKKRMYNDFKQIKVFKDNESIFNANVPFN